jgi:hypothetical protein
VSYRARHEDPPTEDVLRELLDSARRSAADEIVVETTSEAGDAWVRAGFAEAYRVLVVSADDLERQVAREKGASFGGVHLQSDDVDAIVHAVRSFVPRLGHSRGSCVLPPREGWTSVYDELCDREPEMLRRLAIELSNRTAALVLSTGVEEGVVVRYVAIERGRVVDEYLSVPQHYGELPPGEVIALGANPRLMARLTGANPERVRQVARTAELPSELPPPVELLDSLTRLFGIQGADRGYAAARSRPEAIEIAR